MATEILCGVNHEAKFYVVEYEHLQVKTAHKSTCLLY